MKPEAKYRFCVVAILLFYIPQKTVLKVLKGGRSITHIQIRTYKGGAALA
jgi:hypothetical protein